MPITTETGGSPYIKPIKGYGMKQPNEVHFGPTRDEPRTHTGGPKPARKNLNSRFLARKPPKAGSRG